VRGFYFTTDYSLSRRGIYSDVKDALKAGVKIVQYRNKTAGTEILLKEALKLKKLCKGIKFIINDRVDIALAVDASGVHLGQEDLSIVTARKLLGKGKIIGITVHNLKEAKKAQKLGADYLGVSPIFSTATKKDAGKPGGIKLIWEIKKHVSLPVVAIGGINLSNAQEVVRVGVDMLCAISAVLKSRNITLGIKKFQCLFR